MYPLSIMAIWGIYVKFQGDIEFCRMYQQLHPSNHQPVWQLVTSRFLCWKPFTVDSKFSRKAGQANLEKQENEYRCVFNSKHIQKWWFVQTCLGFQAFCGTSDDFPDPPLHHLPKPPCLGSLRAIGTWLHSSLQSFASITRELVEIICVKLANIGVSECWCFFCKLKHMQHT